VHGSGVDREAVRLARTGAPRAAVVAALAQESDAMQRKDRARMQRYARAAGPYLQEFQRQGIADMPLPQAHQRALALADTMLPQSLPE
jgi:hypothetical protein